MDTSSKDRIFSEASSLSREDKVALVSRLQESLKRSTFVEIRVGSKVKFPSKTGATIFGEVVKVNGKSIRVSSMMDKHGNATLYPLNWIVSPTFVVPV